MTLHDGVAADPVASAEDDTPASDKPAPRLTLELLLHPDDLTAVTRLSAVTRSAPSRPIRLLWYDDEAQSLAAAALALRHDGASWLVERLEPGDRHDWPACIPPPIVDRADDPSDLSPTVSPDILPIGAFDGRSRLYHAGEAAITLLHGQVRGVVETRPACRLTLTGPAHALTSLLSAWDSIRLAIPRASLAREALAAARGTTLPSRHLGAPSLHGDSYVGDGLATIIAHLLDVLLHWTDAFNAQPKPEAIHQARVATRRLRSALSIYRSVAPCPDLAEIADAVKHCAATLGAARDWDVFLAGAGSLLSPMAGRDPRLAALLRAAARRREIVYAQLSDYLASPRFRHLTLSLGTAAVLRPWHTEAAQTALQAPTAAFAATVLSRRLKHIRRRGRDIQTLPVEMLHELRKDCKRLRYAAEFFAPAFPEKRTRAFLRRLSALQEELGMLNDTTVSSHLMAQLGRPGRGYAGGVVNGIAVASTLAGRNAIITTWKRFKRADPFWR